MRYSVLILSLIMAAVSQRMLAVYFLATFEFASEGLTAFVTESAFTFEKAVPEIANVAKITLLEHTFAMIFIVNKVTFIITPRLLVSLLTFAMSFITTPLPTIHQHRVLESTQTMSHAIRDLTFVVRRRSYQTTVSPHVIVLPSTLIV